MVEKSKTKRIDYKTYEMYKRRAINFEEHNYRYIVVIPCEGNEDWCEMCEYSALYYKYLVCEPHGTPVTMSDDLDSFYLKYEIGKVRTRGFDVVRRRLQKTGMYASEQQKDDCMVFEMKQKVSQAQREKLLKEEITRQDEVNSIVKVQFVSPAFYQQAVLAAKRLHQVCRRRLDKISRDMNGSRMIGLMDGVLVKYFLICEKNLTDPEEIEKELKPLRDDINLLLIELQVLAALKLWPRELSMSVAKDIIALQEIIEKDIVAWNRRASKKK